MIVSLQEKLQSAAQAKGQSWVPLTRSPFRGESLKKGAKGKDKAEEPGNVSGGAGILKAFEDSVPKCEPEPNEHKDRLIDRANLRVDKDVQFLLR